ncbi:MAG: InlB B-repeat-containing protein [Chitinispirillales bacterium]|jgi:uncharacterized repeat protein (TIGR02543 family)|nr:InlB B-repeat-containing protein [Chitinispirillales bacterium]
MERLKSNLAVSVITAVSASALFIFVGCSGNDDKAVEFTITYDANVTNFAKTIPSNVTVKEGEKVTLAGESDYFNRRSESLYLTVWNTDAAGTGTSYNPSQTITPTGNLTLYAQWSVNSPAAKARITFYGGEKRIGDDLQNRNQLYNEDGTFNWYSNAAHRVFGYGGITVEEAYMVLKYPTVTATHEGSARGLRHAGGTFTLGDIGDHSVGPTYAVKLTNFYPSRLGTIEIDPGEYGDPLVRVFWPGSDGVNANVWWDAMVDVDNGAKAALKAANAGYVYKGKMSFLTFDTTQVGENTVISVKDSIVYDYEIRGRKEIGPIPLPTRQQTQQSGQVMQWDLAGGDELQLNILTHSNRWMSRYQELQVYKDLDMLDTLDGTADRKILITPETMVNYSLRVYDPDLVSDTNRNNFPVAGKTLSDLIDDELFRPADVDKNLGQRLGFDLYYSKQYKR